MSPGSHTLNQIQTPISTGYSHKPIRTRSPSPRVTFSDEIMVDCTLFSKPRRRYYPPPFPPFSTRETIRSRGVKRNKIYIYVRLRKRRKDETTQTSDGATNVHRVPLAWREPIIRCTDPPSVSRSRIAVSCFVFGLVCRRILFFSSFFHPIYPFTLFFLILEHKSEYSILAGFESSTGHRKTSETNR